MPEGKQMHRTGFGRFVLGAAIGALCVSACASVGPEPSVPQSMAIPSTALPSIAVPSVAVPSVAPSALPTDPLATTKLPKTPKPPKSATPSQPTGPAAANLIVTKFVTDVDPIVAGRRPPAESRSRTRAAPTRPVSRSVSATLRTTALASVATAQHRSMAWPRANRSRSRSISRSTMPRP